MMKRPLTKIWMSVLLATVCTAAVAQIYVWTDPATGKKVYSDQPPPANAKDSQTKNFGVNVVSSGGLPFAVQDAMKRNPVVLYVNKCDLCGKALTLLNNRGVPFTQRNPETEPAAAEQLKKLIGTLEVPVMTVGAKVLKGYDEANWTAALDAAGYPKTSMKGIKPADSSAAKPVPGATTPAATGSSSTGTGTKSGTSSSAGTSSGSSSTGTGAAGYKPPGE